MANPTRELASVDLPRGLIFTSAISCGVLAALAAQIYLRNHGYDLVSFWQNPQAAKALFPWWTVAGLAFVASGATGAVLSRLPSPWRRFRLLRWVAGIALVFFLAGIDHPAAAAPAASPGATTAANLAALGVAALMAMLGGYFTVRR
jgi:hypothetical protein